MSAPTPATAARILHDDIVAYITQADEALKEGEVVVLSELDTAVDALCKRILALEPEEAKLFASHLQALMTRLNGLQSHMQTALRQCKASMDEVNKRQRAAKAYKPPSSKG